MTENPHIIGYRAIKHRRTGQIVTAPSPMFAEDFPYRDVAPNQALLRYMDFWKFEDLFRTQTLYFCRADKFLDPLEGTLSVEGVHGTSASDVAFNDRVKIAPRCYAEIAAYRDIAKAVTFVNCWHINNKDTAEMWDAYTTSTDSVLVISSGERIKAAVPQSVAMSAVKYVDAATPRTEFDERSLFFYKDAKFEFEREYRLLIDLKDCGDSIYQDHPDDFFRRVSADLSALVYAIQPHPHAPEGTKARIAALVAKFYPMRSV